MTIWPDIPSIDLPVVIAHMGEGSSVSPWISTAINIVAGGMTAILGGFAGAYLSEHFARQRRASEKLAAETASAFALQIQLMGIYSDLLQYREHLGQSRVAHRSRQGNGYRSQFHQGFSGEQCHVNFAVADLQALASYGSEPLLNLVADLDRRLNGIVDALNIYRTTWLELSATMSGDVVGSLVRMSLTQEEIRRLTPKLATQSKILNDIDPMVDELVDDTFRAVVGLYQARVKKLGLTKAFEGIAPDNKYVIIQPDPNAVPPGPRPLSEK